MPELRGELQLPELHARYATAAYLNVAAIVATLVVAYLFMGLVLFCTALCMHESSTATIILTTKAAIATTTV